MVIKKELNIDVSKHFLVPKHIKLTDKEKEQLFQRYNITEFNLPKILSTDPAIKALKPEPDQVIRIERKSMTAGKTVYYRVVV